MRIPFYSPFLCFSLVIFSCKNIDHHDNSKKYHFDLHVSTGARYYFNINTETATKVSVMGKDMESVNESEIGLIYEVVNSTADSILVKVTYDKLHLGVKNKAGEQEINTDNAGHSFDKMEKQLGAVKGSSMNIVLNSKGDILRVEGGKEIADKLLSTTTLDAATQNRNRELLDKFIGDEFVKNNLAREFKLFPDSAVAVGDTWQMKSILPAELKADAVTKFTFEDLTNKLATVKSAAEINTDSKTSVMGNEVTMNTKGKQEGHFETDALTGLLMNGQSTTTMEGNFLVMGKDVPVSIKVTKHITGKKM